MVAVDDKKIDALGDKLDRHAEAIQSLQFDNERVIKPALTDIREILNRDIYTPKVDHHELKAEVEKLRDELEKEKERTRNYQLVERLVFGLVGVVMLAVIGALVALVVGTKTTH